MRAVAQVDERFAAHRFDHLDHGHERGIAARCAMQVFRADAVVHLGKHGNLEWLPGKALALSDECWPELCLGPTPLIYPFIVNDPGEGAQAKRRTSAVIVDHLMPAMTRAELHGPLAALETMIDEYALAAGVDRRSIVVDPGIGFGKTARDSWRLLSALELLAPGYPVLVGHSRKSFLDPGGRQAPGERLAQSLAAGLLATLNGAAILRVHEVGAHARMLEAYRAYEAPGLRKQAPIASISHPSGLRGRFVASATPATGNVR